MEDSKDMMKHESAMIPTSMCPGMKPGDMINMKVKDIQGDMMEVEYVPDQMEEEKEMSMDEMNKPDMMDSMKQMKPEMMRKKLPKADRGY